MKGQLFDQMHRRLFWLRTMINVIGVVGYLDGKELFQFLFPYKLSYVEILFSGLSG